MLESLVCVACRDWIARLSSVRAMLSPRSKREPDAERCEEKFQARFCLVDRQEVWKASKFGVGEEPRWRVVRISWQRS